MFLHLINPPARAKKARITGFLNPFSQPLRGILAYRLKMRDFQLRPFVRSFLQKRLELVNIKSMLVRLGCAMNRTDLFEQMMLRPEPVFQNDNSDKSINLVVGYNASHHSQTALDLTLWIAHQSRLATQKQVTVQVVYVMAEKPALPSSTILQSANISDSSIHQFSRQPLKSSVSNKSTTSVLTKPKSQHLVETSRQTSEKRQPTQITNTQAKSLKQAEQILSQARCLAEEWGSDFKAHLRFGDVARELRGVVESTSATALLLGCKGPNNGMLQKIGYSFPCSILGIPNELN